MMSTAASVAFPAFRLVVSPTALSLTATSVPAMSPIPTAPAVFPVSTELPVSMLPVSITGV